MTLSALQPAFVPGAQRHTIMSKPAHAKWVLSAVILEDVPNGVDLVRLFEDYRLPIPFWKEFVLDFNGFWQGQVFLKFSTEQKASQFLQGFQHYQAFWASWGYGWQNIKAGYYWTEKRTDIPQGAEVIPNAIVMKNVPLRWTRPQILQRLFQRPGMGFKAPWGCSRLIQKGAMPTTTVFLNFHAEEDAALAITALNHTLVMGVELVVQQKIGTSEAAREARALLSTLPEAEDDADDD